MPDALRDEIATALANATSTDKTRRRRFCSRVPQPRGHDCGCCQKSRRHSGTRQPALLDALSQAGGLLPDAGPEIIVDQPGGSSQRLSVRELFDGFHPGLNIPILAGAQIRVPQRRTGIRGRRRQATGSLSLSESA